MIFKKSLFLAAFVLATVAVLTSLGLEPQLAYAAPVSIDCSSGSPRNIAQGTDFSSGDDLTLTGAGTCVLTTTASLTSLTVGTVGGDATVLTQAATDTTGVDVTTTGDIMIYSGASVDVDTKGYAEGVGTGQGTDDWVGSGGGAHGGVGGTGNNSGAGGTTYGSVTNPTTLGSGGGDDAGGGCGNGGSGGGYVELNATGTLTISGTITADGEGGESCRAGGGSGGSVNLTAGTLAGAGTISADGGNGTAPGGGGGGGRIAILYTTDSSTIISGDTYQAYGGSQGTPTTGGKGGAGTIYTKAVAASNGDLIIDNNDLTDGQETLQATTASQTYDAVTIRDGAEYVIPNTHTLTVASGGTFTGGGTQQPLLTIDSGGEFDAPSATFTFQDIDVTNGGNVDVINSLTLNNSTFTHNGAFNAIGEVTSLSMSNSSTFHHNGTGFAATSLSYGGSSTFIYQSASESLTVTTLTVQNTGTFEQRKTGAVSIATSITVQSGGTLTHTANTTAKSYELNLSSATIDIQSGGTVNVDGKGYAVSEGTGAGTDDFAGDGGGSHGGTGGTGGASSASGVGGSTYGSVTSPATLGSGGGNACGPGGAGAGAVKLVASGTLTLNGSITADGNSGTGCRGGGGSGGAVWLDAGTLAGAGTITADGGIASTEGGGGGGGRVAIYYTTDSSTIISGDKIQAYGGSQAWVRDAGIGGAGTIYTKASGATNGDLIVDNNDYTTDQETLQVAGDSYTFDNITIRDGADYEFPSTSNLTVASGGTLTGGGTTQPSLTIDGGIFYPPHSSGVYTLNGLDLTLQNSGSIANWTDFTLTDSTFDYGSGFFGSPITDVTIGSTGTLVPMAAGELSGADIIVQSGGTFTQEYAGTIDIGTLTVQSGGTLTHGNNSSSKTYEVNLSGTTIDIQSGATFSVTGLGFDPGLGDGDGEEDFVGPGGGAHGGNGGAGSAVAGGTAYGDEDHPITMGSGGGGNCGVGGLGGGVIKLVTSGTLTINANISANGDSSTITCRGGGGAGGSIWLDGETLAGTATISANGSNGTVTYGGGGGGGRIAIYYGTDNSTYTRQVNGGTGVNAGSVGSIVFVQKQPLSTNFPTGNGTTDFNALSDYTAISNMKLANSNASITWTGATVDAEGENYDSYVSFGTGYVSMDPANVKDSLSNDTGTVSGFSATVNITVDGCDSYTIYYANAHYTSLNDIKTNGQVCNAGTTPACTNISCAGATLAFDVPHFDGYGGEGQSANEDITTTVGVGNVSPLFTVTPSDGGSFDGSATVDTDGNPTAVGSDVTFTATAKDVNADQYFMAICKTDAVTSGGASAPTCDGGAWAIATEANSDAQASVTYTALAGDPESNDWYAFICDKVAGGSCYPANGSGDQGLAVGTVTFADVPADEDDITIDLTQYRFDTGGDGCVGAGTCIDVSADEDGNDAASSLAAAEAGSFSHMIVRSNVVYVYADTAGVSGLSVDMAIGTCANCSVSGATLAGGDDNAKSPFKVDHAGTFGSVTFTDDASGTIEPGDTVRFTIPQANLADSDTDNGQDTMNIYICSGEADMGGVTTAFNYESDACTNGTLLCSHTGVNPTTTDATCDDTQSIVSVPTAHGTYDVKVYVEDNHSFPATGTETQTFTVTDVAPALTSYTATDTPSLTAGGSDVIDFSVAFTDDNGDNDVTGVEGVLFDDTAIANNCTSDENDCYVDATCTLTLVSTPGTGKTATGTDSGLGADCSVTVWFNTNASANWEVHAKPTDGLGQETGFLDSSVNLTFAALQGIDVTEASIAYGTVAIGGTSSGAETSMGNVGNQILDMYIDGDDMCTDFPTCSGSSIGVAQQKWHHNASTFDWDASAAAGPYALVDTASGTADAGGCLNRDIAIRNDHTLTTTNESVFWKLRIPSSQAVGSYTGQTTFATTASGTCTTGQSY